MKYILYNVYVTPEYSGIEQVEIMAISKNLETLIEKMKKDIKTTCELDDWVLDNECNLDNIGVHDIIRLFWEHQENWGCYVEYFIENMEEI